MRTSPLLVCAFALAHSSACTFYTQCPPGDGGGPVAGSPSGASGGSGNGTGQGGSNVTNGGVGGTVPDAPWVNVTSDLAGLKSDCGNVSHLTAKPDEDMLIAGVASHGLLASTDGGDSWQAIGTGAGSDPIDNRASGFVFDPAHPKVFWETGIYGPAGGVFKTDDDGDTFTRVGDFFHNDSLSVDFDDPDRNTMLVSGHEQNQILYRSSDAGQTWDSIGENVPPEASISSFPVVIDPKTYLLGCPPWGQGSKSGIYRSTDAGKSWKQVSEQGGAVPPLRASDGSIYWINPQDSGMVRSTDDGKTWDQAVGGGVISSVKPIELPDERIVAAGQYLMASTDHGQSWTIISSQLPFRPQGFVYSIQRKAFFAWKSTCETTIPEDAVMRFDFDWETE